jgi:hypothetical protein
MSQIFRAEPREVLLEGLTDFEDMPQYMPNIERIQVLAREKTDDAHENISVRVFASVDSVPPIARPFMKPKDMNWKEFYTVDYENIVVDWRVETPQFTEFVDCRGTSYCKPHADGCELVIDGRMIIHTPPGTLLGGPVGRAVTAAIEPFIGKLVTLNMKKFFTELSKAMDKKKAVAAARA